MPRKRKLLNLADRCRFCLARDSCMSDLFVDWLKPRLQDLKKCTSIEVLDKPNFPKSICYVCLYKLEMWNEFKSQFLKTNRTLLSHFKCVEPSEKGMDNSLTSQNALSLNFDNYSNNQKRLKMDVQELQTVESCANQIETNVEKIPFTQLTEAPANEESVETAVLDVLHGSNSEDNEATSVTKTQPSDTSVTKTQPSDTSVTKTQPSDTSITKTQPSDTSVTNSRKIGVRSKKIERVASTKRWEERKNALIAATGKASSESDSDSGAQLSPVQKARARSNNEKEQENQRRKIEKALKNLETNMTEKYRINQEDVNIDVERKTRSRTMHIDDHNEKETKFESSKLVNNERKLEQPLVETNETNKKDVSEIPKSPIKEPEKKPLPCKEFEKLEEHEETEATKSPIVVNEAENDLGIPESIAQPNESIESVSRVENLDNDAVEVDPVVKEFDKSFSPQTVSTEVSIGNSTYIVTTTLDIPNDSSPSKNDNSLKTNGINIDTISQDNQTVELLNTVQIECDKSMDESTNKDDNSSNASQSDAQKCLKIEIEGMEVDALHRVQLELDQFVKEEIRNRVVNEIPAKRKTVKKSMKFKGTYEALDHQLKTIIEKVLRTNFEADKYSEKSWSINNKKISLEFLNAAKVSPVFQPNVVISRLNIGELSKINQINHLNLLENGKRRVGPLSRTLGKRKHILPKKYDGFSLTMKADDNEKPHTITAKPTATKSIVSTPVELTNPVENLSNTSIKTSQFSMDFEMEDTKLSVNNASPETITAVQKSSVKVIPTESLQSVVEEKPKLSPVFNRKLTKPLPIIREVPSSRKAVELSVESTFKTLPFKQKESVKSHPLKPSTDVSEKSGSSLSPATELAAIKSKSLPVKYPKLKDIPRPVITVVNSNKSSLPLPSIARRVTNSISPANKASAPSPKLPLPSLSNKNSVKNSTVNNAQKSGKRQRHICGICGKELFSKEEAEAHVKNHTGESVSVTKNSTNANEAPTPLLQSTRPKPKLMRCKRCQAIVEARNVKTHVCDSVKYKCRLCECSFGAEHLLVAHLETHTQIKEKPNAMKPPLSTIVKKNTGKEPQRIILKKERYKKVSDPHQEEDLDEGIAEKETQGYSCFVCDKVFIDEEQMKDHLQMHCEEVSDESNEKGFQCAFCGEKFQTEESLETHVGDHLLEDGDEKINMLINIGTRRDKQKKTVFRCEQCSETFSSSLLLAMHLPMHEEEAAETMIDEYEKQQHHEAELDHHVCVICDEIFDTSEELSEHQDVHNGNAHVCILCEKPFSSIKDLQEHVSTHL